MNGVTVEGARVEGPAVWEVVLPQLGETVTEGTVVRWLCEVGQWVERDAALYEVSTDKVDTEIPAARAGWLREVLVGEGGSVPVGSPVAVMSAEPDSPVEAWPTGDGAVGDVASGARVDGAAVDGAAVDGAASGGPIDAPAEAGRDGAASGRWPQWTPARVGGGAGGGAGRGGAGRAGSSGADSSGAGSSGAGRAGVFLSPVVRRLLEECGLGADDVVGTGSHGRVTRADVLAAAAQRRGAGAGGGGAGGAGQVGSAAVVLPAVGDGDEVVPYGRARAATARAMEASRRGPVCTHVSVQVRWAAVERVRAAAGLTYLPFVARALCAALGRHPAMNAHTDGEVTVVRGSVHLGVAVQADGALVVPVVADAHRLVTGALAGEIASVVEAARRGRWVPTVAPTFTVTNVGRWGTVFALPELVVPQVGILSLDSVSHQPVAVWDGDAWAVSVQPVGNLTLGFDHRAVDGAAAAAFLDEVRRGLEERDWGAEL